MNCHSERLAKNLLTCLRYLVVLLFAFTLFTSPAFAQSASPSAIPSSTLQPQNPASSFQLPASIPPTSPLYTDLIVNNMFHTFSCLMIGGSIIGQPCLTYQVTKNAQGAIQTVPVLSQVNLSGGALGATTSLIGALYANPPLRTIDYVASLGEQLGIVKTANAQVIGSGNQVLSPILSLWQVSRNIAYLAMIVVFVIIGLMVLFRNRINPQTVITAQAALPGLVIGLILITFSYFLAALISDMAFVGTNLVGAYFSTAINPTNHPEGLVKDLSDPSQPENILSIFGRFTGIINWETVHGPLDSVWTYLHVPSSNPFNADPAKVLTLAAMFIAAQFVLPFGSLGGGIGQLIGGLTIAGITAEAPTFIISLSLSFIATLVLIYAMFRLLIRLINNFLSIIFLTITAPFQFLAASLPGRQGIATSWILHMISNVLAFPAVIAVFYFIAFLLEKDFGPLKVSDASIITGGGFIPNVFAQTPTSTSIVGRETFPLFGGLNVDFIKSLLAFGALVATPAIPDIIARSINAVSQAGQLIGQEVSGSVTQGRSYSGQFNQALTGFPREAGNMREQAGFTPRTGGGWERVTSSTPNLTAEKAYQSGVRPGQWGRFRAGLRRWF